MVQPARKIGGLTPGSGDPTLAGGAGNDRLGSGAAGKPGASSHGKRPGGGGPAERFTPEQLDEAEEDLHDKVREWSEEGNRTAAANMRRFLERRGGIKEYSRDEARQFALIRDAEEKNQSSFENETFLGRTDGVSAETLLTLRDGETIPFEELVDPEHGYVDSVRHWFGDEDGFYSFGRMTFYSKGGFTATRRGDKIHITGTVKHGFNDPYDFHPEWWDFLTEEAYMLQESGRGKQFENRGMWGREVSGTVEIFNGFLVNPQFDWKDVDHTGGIKFDWE